MNERSNHSESRSFSDPGASRLRTKLFVASHRRHQLKPSRREILDGRFQLYMELKRRRKAEFFDQFDEAWIDAAVTGIVTCTRLPSRRMLR
jgi:hypothetical protein